MDLKTRIFIFGTQRLRGSEIFIFAFLGGGMRQLWQTSGWLLQNGPICYNNFGRNLGKKLEWAEIRHNFASEIRNDIAL